VRPLHDQLFVGEVVETNVDGPRPRRVVLQVCGAAVAPVQLELVVLHRELQHFWQPRFEKVPCVMPLCVFGQIDDLYVVASGPVLPVRQPGHSLS